MNMLEQLARIVLPKEILDNFDIVKIETDESDIDSMSMTIYLDERMNAYLQKLGVLFTFPSRYWYTIGLTGVFSLAGWARRIRAGLLVSRVTQEYA